MKDWNSTVETPRSKGTSPSGNSRGSMTTPTRSPGYSTAISSPDSISFHGGEASLEKLNQSLSDFVMTNFSEVLEQERLKHEQRYNAKVEEMTALQTLVDELNGKVANLTNVVKGLEDDKSDLERELNLQNKEIMRMEAEGDSMKAFMKSSLNL
jgi:hypothetical protein